MSEIQSEVSGVWSGRFWFDSEKCEAVPFSAWLTSTDGRMTGSTLEPSSCVSEAPGELDASIRGHQDGHEIVFLKTYHGLKREPIYCEGELVDNGVRIVGRWYFGWPDEETGAFEMLRDLTDTNAERSETAEADPSNGRGT